MINLLSMQSQFLYLDPSAVTALATSVTAIVVALGATFIILWRKFKKGVSKTFHIDENANKEVEDELVINDASVEENAESAEDAKKEEPENKENEQKEN